MSEPSGGQNSLFQHVASYASSKGFQFGPGAERDIRGYADEALAEIRQGTGSEAEAMKNFERLVDTMIDAIPVVYRPEHRDSNEIGEQTLDWAKKKLCPIWPICKKAYP